MERPACLSKIRPILYFLLVFSLFLPIRYVFPDNFSNITGIYSDFTSFSLYSADLVIFALLLINFRYIGAKIKFHHVILLLITWFLGNLVLLGHSLNNLNLYFLVRFLEGLVLYLIFTSDPSLPKRRLIYWFSYFTAIESILALVQFVSQHSIGLYRLGESHLNQSLIGAAKIVSHGTKYIRGYGTFPHPNILAAFLLVGILFSLYLLFTSPKNQQWLFYILLILNCAGLAVTFSRAGVAAGVLVLVVYFAWLLFTRFEHQKIAWAIVAMVATTIVTTLVFHQFLFTRATLTDKAVKDRWFYNQVGFNMVKAHPWQGIGLGTSMLHMQQFTPASLMPWEIQPIHNYYLLVAAEAGLVGLVIILLLFLWHLFTLARTIIKNRSHGAGDDHLYQLTLAMIFFGFLLLMLFDHYFYTTHQPQLLLWLILGFIGREIALPKAYL